MVQVAPINNNTRGLCSLYMEYEYKLFLNSSLGASTFKTRCTVNAYVCVSSPVETSFETVEYAVTIDTCDRCNWVFLIDIMHFGILLNLFNVL